MLSKEPPVFIENAAAFQFFGRLLTQWRAGMGGAYGLDMGTAIRRLEVAGMEGAELADTVERLELMERAYLRDVIGEQRRLDDAKRDFDEKRRGRE